MSARLLRTSIPDMWQWVRAQWTFVASTVLAIIGIALAVLSLTQNTTKSLRILIFSQSTAGEIAVESDESTPSEADPPLETWYVMQFLLHNNGDVAIERSDFEQPLRINFPPQTTIRMAEGSSIPGGRFKVSSSIQGSTLVVDPTLLNPGDTIEFDLLLSHPTDSTADISEISVYPRIAGVDSIDVLNLTEESEQPDSRVPWLFMLLTSAGLGALGGQLMLRWLLHERLAGPRRLLFATWSVAILAVGISSVLGLFELATSLGVFLAFLLVGPMVAVLGWPLSVHKSHSPAIPHSDAKPDDTDPTVATDESRGKQALR